MQEKTLSKRRETIRKMVECALLVAIAVVVDMIPFPSLWAYGGSISLCMIPIVFCSYRNGAKWGLATGFLLSCVQMVTGFYIPPANTAWAIILCVLLDYVLAFTALGAADIFAKMCGKFKAVGYAMGVVAVGLIRFVCSFISGVALWESSMPAEFPIQNIYVYSLVYNGSYMLLNIVLTVLVITLLCGFIDPKTLKPVKKNK